MPLLKRLTFKETYLLWGGLRLNRLDGTNIYYKDVTETVLALPTPLPPDARVAAIHLNLVMPLLTQLVDGQRVTYTRRLLAARQVLVDQGFTHVALTGPLLSTLRVKARLNKIAGVAPHPALSMPIAFATWVVATGARSVNIICNRKRGNSVSSLGEVVASFGSYRIFALS
jgi:hypothetical protein